MIEKTVQVTSVSPGPHGGCIVFGMPTGERERLRCKIRSQVATRIPAKGEFWVVKGEMGVYEDEPQITVESCWPISLPSSAYVSSLLAFHPAFRGFSFGKKKIHDLLAEFSEDELVELLNAGNVFVLSKALAFPIANELVTAWQRLNSENEVVKFLIDNKFSASLARKVMRLCGEGTIDRLKKNPYSLVCFGGVTKNIWGTMERCAKNLGLQRDFSGRLVGGIEHVLYGHLREGHTTIKKDVLLNRAEMLLGTTKRASEGLRLALEKKAVCVYPAQSGQLFQLTGVGAIEQLLENRIDKLVSSSPSQLSLFNGSERAVTELVESYDKNIRAKGGFEMNKEQKSAVVMALTHRCSVMTGYGGTGKTTVLKAVGDVAKSLNRNVYMLALAGKAKERLREATAHKSFTVHAFIGAVKKGAEDICLDDDPLIVIDEASMVDTLLFNSLLELLEGRDFSLLTVGDPAQISPVGFGLVWHRMAILNSFPRTHLTQVYRQRSSLHDLAMKIRSGDEGALSGLADSIPDWDGESGEGVFFVPAAKANLNSVLFETKHFVDEMLQTDYVSHLQRGGPVSDLEQRLEDAKAEGLVDQSVILTPHMSERKGDSGHKINRHLQSCITPLADSLLLGERRIRVGDPVIVTDNSYDLGLFNGTTGTLLEASTREGKHVGCFRFEGREDKVWLTVSEMLDVGIQLAYAVSIHKSQGSEYEAVLVTCIEKSEMLEKSLLYTALTRSKGLCLVVGSREVFTAAVTAPSRADTLEVGFFLSRVEHQFAMAS